VVTRTLSPLCLLIAIVIACVAACSSDKRGQGSSKKVEPAIDVPLVWQAARTLPGHRVHVGERGLPCSSCHELRGTSMGPVNPSRCASCHEKEARSEHASSQARDKFGPGAKTDCATCHVFAPPKREGGADASLTLERLVAPSHADGGDASAPHGATARPCLDCHRVDQGHAPAVIAHDKATDCLHCHQPHSAGAPTAAPCVTCHENVSLSHAAHGGEAGCKQCHTHQHARAADALGTCESCHTAHEPKVPFTALFAGGHEQCVSCHQPHEFAKELAKPCRSCHEKVHVLAETEVPAHRQCTSCHQPHDVRGTPKASCVGCHAELHPDHPKVAGMASGAGACVGCHDPHPDPGATPRLAKPCTSCHQAAHSDTAFHSGIECVKCHTPHDFVLADGGKTVCKSCHESKFVAVAGNPGHQACAGCHAGVPHQPTSGQNGCPTCHAAEHARVNPGHATCTNCHEPHGGTVKSTCQNCHAVEAKSAPAGHQKCLGCHEEHSGAPEHAVCATCHAKEAESKHGHLSADCSSCHVPHGPAGPTSPPPCASCHATAKLPGLHQLGKHDECKNCHSGHDAPAAIGRAACLGCHQDRTQHFPDAARCISCHLFD
jgi:hypothetical protein